jgi:hypothetical protein
MLLFACVFVTGVTGFVYEQSTQTFSQTIIDVATIELNSQLLGNLCEGESKTFTKNEVPSLGNAIAVSVSSPFEPVNLNIYGDLDELSVYYSQYDVVVKFSRVVGESYSVGEVACILGIGGEDYGSIELDAIGVWVFDLEISATAKSVNDDTTIVANIMVKVDEA